MLSSQIIERMNEWYVDDSWREKTFAEVVEELKNMTEEERLEESINGYREQRDRLIDESGDMWHVYMLCKSISNIAELTGGKFKELPLVEKMIQFTTLIKQVDEDEVFKGVREFHESEWCR
jgi:phosphoribosyl-ATP pyrophosphohydrolase